MIFVSRAKYMSALSQSATWQAMFTQERQKHNETIKEWNELIGWLNRFGGRKAIDIRLNSQPPQLSKDDIRKLIQLVHPDKHQGKPLAVEMTARLLAIKVKDHL